MDPLIIIKEALKDKYQIQKVIGKGGMATVYKAIQTNLDRPVALKVIHQNLVHDEEFIKRFLREAQVCASLSHPNIITVYDVGSVGTVHYMSMEYLEGRTVRDIIKDKGRISYEDTLSYVTPIAEVLAYMHDRNMVHRDVKSSNIFITNGGRVVLMDFGIVFSEGRDPLSHDGAILGTPEYMSPEQAIGKEKIDGRSDIYSLGMIMYECLTGRLPFQSENYFSTLTQVVYDKPPTITSINPRVPKWLSSIVSLCLVKDRNLRIQDGRTLVKAFKKKESPEIPVIPEKKTDETIRFRKNEFVLPKNSEAKKKIKTETTNRVKLQLMILAAIAVIVFIMVYLVFGPPSVQIASKEGINNTESNPDSIPAIAAIKNSDQKDPDINMSSAGTINLQNVAGSPSSKSEPGQNSDIENLINDADRLLETGNFQEAINRYQRILNVDHTNSIAKQRISDSRVRWINSLIRSGRSKLESENFDAALSDFSKALELEPGNRNVEELLSKVHAGQIEADYFKSLGIEEILVKNSPFGSYRIETTEVTQRLWYEIMQNNPSNFKTHDLLPVENVSYNDVKKFIDNLNDRTGKNYRLPTADEWLFAAKGGDKSANYKYSGGTVLSQIGWYEANSGNSTHAVMTKAGNEIGLFDMSGNVWEWTSTFENGSVVTKGGCWFSTNEYCSIESEQLMQPDARDKYTGFRLCRNE